MLSNKLISAVLLITVLLFNMNSCRHEIFDINEEISETAIPCNPDVINFSTDILPILSASCAIPGCHDNNTPTAFVDLSSYDAVMSTKVRGELIVVPGVASQSTLWRSLKIMDIIVPMPPPFNLTITAAQENLIKDWINQGATNPEPCLDITCDTNKFDWSTTIRPIMRTYCNGCHYGDYAAAGIELSFHAQVKELALDGDLYNSITGGQGLRRMPLNEALPDCKIIQIRKWIDNGAPRD